jgi:restriction endonuclease S subunit
MLGDVCNRITCGPFGSTLVADEHSDRGEVVLIQPTDIADDIFTFDSGWRIEMSTMINKGLPLCPPNALVFARVGIYPHCGVVPERIGPATIGSKMIAAEVGKSADPYFLQAFFRSETGQDLLLAAQKVTAQPTLSTEEIAETEVPFPSSEVQLAIGNKIRKAERLRELSMSHWRQANDVFHLESRISLSHTMFESVDALSVCSDSYTCVSTNPPSCWVSVSDVIAAQYYHPRRVHARRHASSGNRWQRFGDLATARRSTGVIGGQAREQQKVSDAENAVVRHERALNELRSEAQAETASLIPAAIRANQKRLELVGRIDGHRTALAGSCGNLPLNDFVAEVSAADLDLLPSALERVREEIGTLENQKATFTSERDAIDKEFQVREAAVALRTASCEKESAAARIEALTAEYIEQQLGSTLLAKAMALYREKHQDPLLKRAGEYFATLTCGAFVGLAIDEDENQRVLKGIRAQGGTHLDLDAMSDGTRDQLFLALRLAYIENYCENTAVCPVILDDVLMAFDDERTAATLRALLALSRKTQVLVFTHHNHHVALANATLGEGGYRLHELASPPVSSAA